MPSAFEQRMTSSLSRLYTAFGVAAVYTGPDGVAVSGISVRVQRQESREAAVNQSVVESQPGEIFVQQSAVAKPVKHGRFALEGGVEIWSIESTPVLKNGQWNCIVKRVSTERRMEKRTGDGK